jgi:PAS domain S-box-containing protein
LKASARHKKGQGTAFPFANLNHSWLGAVELAVAIGIAYFLAARLGLVLTSQAGLAFFWPAAGIATGTLIVLGPATRLPVAIAVTFASVACSLTVGRSIWVAIPFSLVNAGHPLITAWLIQRWFGAAFKLEAVPQVLGFLVASAIAVAIGSVVAAIAVGFAEPTAFPLEVWRIWFSAGLLGTITVAPLLIGLGEAVRDVPPRRELIEGGTALVALTALSAFLISMPQGPWATALPVAFMLPLLLWVAVRCRPMFAAAAMFMVTLAVVWSATFNLGHFGDASIPLADRILAAQTLVLAGTLLALVLAALFCERRRSEAALQQSKQRLQLALDGAELGTFSADLATGRFECDARVARIHGHGASPVTIIESRRFVHPDDRAGIDAALAEANRSGGRWNAEYRVLPPPDHPHAGETRWIAVESSIVRDRQGIAVGLLGVTRDITDRKRAEQALAERNAQLTLAGTAGLVGSFGYDVNNGKMQVSEGYVAIHGLPRGTTETTRRKWRDRLHPEEIGRLDALRSQAFAERRREYNVEYRIVLPDRGMRWIESRSFISYDGDGNPQRVVGVNIDVTERKRTELALQASEAKCAGILAIAGDAIVSINANQKITLFNEAAEKVFGYSQAEMLGQPIDLLIPTRFRAAHRRDIEHFASGSDSMRRVAERREVMGLRKDGEEFPAEASISKLDVGGERYYTAVMRDISDRKRAERALAERNTQLELASKSARVGSFSVDFSTGVVKLTPGCATIYGLPEGTIEASRDELRKLVHPADLPQLEAQRDQAFRARQRELIAQSRIVRANDGEIRWLEVRNLIFFDQLGKPAHLIGINIDITERKQIEALLKDSEARLADALAAGHVMAFAWDAITGLSQRSENAAQVLGFEARGKEFISHVHADDRKMFTTQIRNLSAGRPSYALNFRYVHSDGREVWLEETAKAEFDATGKLVRIKGLTRDITERRRAELALVERNAQLALAGRAALVGTFAYDVETERVQISEGYATIFGFPEGTTEILRSQWQARVHADDLERLQDLRRQAFRQRKGEYSVEYRTCLPGRGVRWIEGRSFILYDGDGHARRMVGVNIDVTERKRADERQRVLVAELDHRVKNVLASVSAVVAHTRQESTSVANFAAALNGRIRSMATTHELLSSGRWQGISLADLIRQELTPYATRNNIDICGSSDIVLRPEAAQAMAVVLHELATNAAKYGALSTSNGRVSIRWQQSTNEQPRSPLVLEWRETGGPPVAPNKSSYGTSIIRELIPYEFGGTVDLVLAAEGVRCRLELPADWLSNDSEPVADAIARTPPRSEDLM